MAPGCGRGEGDEVPFGFLVGLVITFKVLELERDLKVLFLNVRRDLGEVNFLL